MTNRTPRRILRRLVERALDLYAETWRCVPAFLIEDVKWTTFPLFVRPAFAALALNDVGWDLASAAEAIAALGMAELPYMSPAFFVERASTVRLVAGASDIDEDDAVGEDGAAGRMLRFWRLVLA